MVIASTSPKTIKLIMYWNNLKKYSLKKNDRNVIGKPKLPGITVLCQHSNNHLKYLIYNFEFLIALPLYFLKNVFLKIGEYIAVLIDLRLESFKTIERKNIMWKNIIPLNLKQLRGIMCIFTDVSQWCFCDLSHCVHLMVSLWQNCIWTQNCT